MTRLAEADILKALEDLPDWRMERGALRKEFTFKTFTAAIKFINDVADIARTARHHPEIWNSYNRVRLRLSTHDEGGITEKDVAFAQAVEESRNPA